MKRALLLSGGVNATLDFPRYANDLKLFYRTLVTLLGYQKADVRVHAARGAAVDLDGDGTPERVLPATLGQVQEALAWLVNGLAADDQLLLVVTDHGSSRGIHLWGENAYLSPADLAATLAPCPALKVLVLGQCGAGRLNDVSYGRAILCCACGPLEKSHESWPRGDHDEFLVHFGAALAGSYPGGRPLRGSPGTAPVTVAEAFAYAKLHDRWAAPGRANSETPLLFDPGGLAPITRI